MEKINKFNSDAVNERIVDFVHGTEKQLFSIFEKFDVLELHNQKKVLSAFQKEKIAPRHFSQSSGYGYDDIGRDALERVFARIFGCEDALVRPHIASGTHALAITLFGLLMPGDTMVAITGKPYDTLESIIGIGKPERGSLIDYGVKYEQIDLTPDDKLDLNKIKNRVSRATVIHIQRSRGYSWRNALPLDNFAEVIKLIKDREPHATIVVDNCYAEFTDVMEPTEIGADIIVGSLIKNPGGGLAPTGGYIAGTKKAIKLISNRLTSPGIGREVGSYAAPYTPFYQGIFLAPHVTVQALKSAVLFAAVFERLGLHTLPAYDAKRSDIIQSIRFNSADELISFCQSIQKASPVDSHVLPEPWDMPGYRHKVIMAAGTFTQGASIELSADAPIVEPYIAYLQGALTYTHGKLALIQVLKDLWQAGLVQLDNITL